MTYALMIWTVVAMAGDRHYQAKHYDWQQLTQTHSSGNQTGLERCHQAAQQLAIKEYRCIKIK